MKHSNFPMEGTMPDSINFAQLTMLVTLIAALSVAAERLVEIVKGLIPWLNEDKTSLTAGPLTAKQQKSERHRKAALQLLAVIAGIVTTGLAWPAVGGIIPADTLAKQILMVIGIGFLTSGGSGLWNAILMWILHIKNIRENQEIATAKRAEVATVIANRVKTVPPDDLQKLLTELNTVDRDFAAFVRN